MFILPATTEGSPGDLVVSASDIVSGNACAFTAVRRLDALLGRIEPPTRPRDQMLELTAALGDTHEQAVLDRLRDAHDSRVFEVPAVTAYSRDNLLEAHAATLGALAGHDEVVYQGSFFDGTFHGRADFLVRHGNGAWTVADAKLARSAKPAALLQLAAYADQLIAAGVPVARDAVLYLGNGAHTTHPVETILPAYREARSRLINLLEVHRAETGPAQWGDGRWPGCLALTCPDCREQIEQTDDLMLVRGMNRPRRAALMGAGIPSLGAFAATGLPAGADKKLAGLHLQAAMQAGTAEVDGSRNGVSYKIVRPEAISLIPAPDDGDVFFDFEGDPNWRDPRTGDWGIEYLFGLLEKDADSRPAFAPYVAHSRAEERRAFIDFMAHIANRRRDHPGMRIYHYAPYEATALKRLAARHRTLGREVQDLIDAQVLFDLLPVVRQALVLSKRSFSIKALEPLYMPDHREGVATAVDSLVQYAKYTTAVGRGQLDAAQDIFAGILDYNEYDCLSTLKLRDWLLTLANPGQGAAQ
ncbi:TM0106 family RecB-like putative nuclease [Arthrobacter sp. A2-55]|uniref:TM0106 family RecB-like putative nuclease n=1 Tax=Arthrobacter sp. A2-55 TaxID=2897337 RepID=UPI0021CD19FE|nr:TM0106 family RecB-like putative nuclease [Arthrobacter sp. A2-55]MCU6481943.1 TM0106 family RecB-like putative nuclease [Arthrobacter sp. A2-55]